MLVGERVQPHVRPLRQLLDGLQPERDGVLPTVDPDRRQHVTQLLAPHRAHDFDSAQMMMVQPLRQLAQDRVRLVRRDPLDHQLAAGDAEGERVALFEQGTQPALEPLDRRRQHRMPRRVDRELLQRNRELDQKIDQLPWQGSAIGRRDALG